MPRYSLTDDSLGSRPGGALRAGLARLSLGSGAARAQAGSPTAADPPGSPASRRGGESPPPRRPPRRPGTRGVSEVVGFILIFGVVVLGVTLVQLYGVPATNERLEFEHSQRALGDVAEVGDLFGQVATTGQPGSVTVEAGMSYPSRLFLFNPPPVSGGIQTTHAGAVSVANAVGVGEEADYWNGDERSFPTAAIAYRSGYHLYDFAPTRYVEHGLIYDRFQSGNVLPRNRAPLVEGRTVSIVTLTGEVDRASAGSIVLEAAPQSVPRETVTLTNRSPTDLIEITLPTGLSGAEMEAVLAHERGADGRVSSVTDNGDGTVTVALTPGTYEVSLARLQVGTAEAPAIEPHYLVPVTDSPVTIGEGSNATVAFQVRDELNNPVAGVAVEAAAGLATARLEPINGTADGDGIVRFEYVAPGQIHGVSQVPDEVRATIGGDRAVLGPAFDRTTLTEASVDLRIQNRDRSGQQRPDDGPGAGYGGVSYWLSNETSQTFAAANGKWLGIEQVGSIVLSDGEMVTHQVCKADSPSGGGGGAAPFEECRLVDELRLSFTLWNQYDAYAVDVQLRDANRDGTFGDTWKPRKIEWNDVQNVTVTDTSGSLVFWGELNATALDGVFTDRGGWGTDILQFEGNYRTGGVGDQGNLDALMLGDANWFTGEMIGRVVVTIP